MSSRSMTILAFCTLPLSTKWCSNHCWQMAHQSVWGATVIVPVKCERDWTMCLWVIAVLCFLANDWNSTCGHDCPFHETWKASHFNMTKISWFHSAQIKLIWWNSKEMFIRVRGLKTVNKRWHVQLKMAGFLLDGKHCSKRLFCISWYLTSGC